MTVGFTLCCRTVVAGATCLTYNVSTSVVRVGWQEACRSMTVTAFRVGDRVGAGRGVGGGRCFTSGHSAVVATVACPGNARMIKAAVRCQLKKTDGIVAVIAFGICRCMRLGFTNSRYAVMAFAAISKYFLMIDKADKGIHE